MKVSVSPKFPTKNHGEISPFFAVKIVIRNDAYQKNPQVKGISKLRENPAEFPIVSSQIRVTSYQTSHRLIRYFLKAYNYYNRDESLSPLTGQNLSLKRFTATGRS